MLRNEEQNGVPTRDIKRRVSHRFYHFISSYPKSFYNETCIMGTKNTRNFSSEKRLVKKVYPCSE